MNEPVPKTTVTESLTPQQQDARSKASQKKDTSIAFWSRSISSETCWLAEIPTKLFRAGQRAPQKQETSGELP